jgi:hypothetical protein
MPAQTPSKLSALQAAKDRWAAAQQDHALRGTPSRELQEPPRAKLPTGRG